MRKLFVLILLMVSLPAAALAQSPSERRAWGYGFVGFGGNMGSDSGPRFTATIYDAEIDGPNLGIGGEVGYDIYVELGPGYDFDPRIAPGSLVSESPAYGNHGANPAQAAMRTLMVFNGPGIRAGQKLANVRIIDFAPTLARLLDLPRPKDATGRVLLEPQPERR